MPVTKNLVITMITHTNICNPGEPPCSASISCLSWCTVTIYIINNRQETSPISNHTKRFL